MVRQQSPRMRKVNELVREVVAEAVTDLKDPRIGFLTITGAVTSPDLRHSVIYYSVLGTAEEKADTATALVRAAPRIQGAIGSQTRLRYTPKLEFRVDTAIDEGLRISQIISDLNEADDGAAAESRDPENGEREAHE